VIAAASSAVLGIIDKPRQLGTDVLPAGPYCAAKIRLKTARRPTAAVAAFLSLPVLIKWPA
jgi:hypothetical protein